MKPGSVTRVTDLADISYKHRDGLRTPIASLLNFSRNLHSNCRGTTEITEFLLENANLALQQFERSAVDSPGLRPVPG